MFGQLGANELASANRGFGIPDLGSRYNELVQGGPARRQFWNAPVATNTTYVHAAVTDTGVAVEVTTGITNPDVPRALSATAGGTAGDIKAIQVTVHGTNIEDNEISESLPAFTVDTAGTVQGSVAFKTVTQIDIPAHDGTGATTAVGVNDKFGFDRILARGNTVILGTVDRVYETTRPTVVTDVDEIEKNTIDFNTAANASRDFEVWWIDAPASDPSDATYPIPA